MCNIYAILFISIILIYVKFTFMEEYYIEAAFLPYTLHISGI